MRRLMRNKPFFRGLVFFSVMTATLSLIGCGGGSDLEENEIVLSSAQAITAFSIISPAATGIVDENAKTISVTVPYGTPVTSLIATFTTTGASVTVGATPQVSGTTPNDFTGPVAYTVTAADATTTTYTVIVTLAPDSAKAITAFSITSPAVTGIIDENAKTISVIVPYQTDVSSVIATFATTGASVAVGTTPQVSGTTPNDFTSPVAYTVTAADASTVDYTVTVTVASNSAKAITVFSLLGISGIVNENNKTISVTVPYGTPVTSLIATFTTTGASVSVGATPQVSGTTPNDFTGSVTYTVTAADGTSTLYIVTVTVASGSAKTITAFSFTSPAVTGIIDEGAKTISVIVPYQTDVSALIATFATTGASVAVGTTQQINGTTPNNFEIPVAYQVTALDSSTAVYTVTVTTVLSPEKAITVFSFTSPAATGIIDENLKTISVTVPFGTADVTALIANFSTTGASVTVGATPQVSGTTPNDFSSVVDYIVTAQNSTTAVYTVTVTIAPDYAKAITGFRFINPVATGTIDENLKTVSVTIPHVPHGTDVSTLIATFTTSGASMAVGATPQVSGTTPNDFTNPVVYTVTAADASTEDYTVTVTRKAASEVSVANFGNASASVFDASSNGDVTALRRLGSVTGLSNPSGIAVDTVNDEIFVANKDNNSITAYIRTATGNMVPVRTISGASTGLNSPSGIAVDTVNNEIFVTNYSSIMVYGRADNGDVVPLRTISGASTGLSDIRGIAVDTVNNEIFVVTYFIPSSGVSVFERTDDGDVAPKRNISGGNTGLYFVMGIAVDTLHNEIFVAILTGDIRVFGRTDNGDVAPARTITSTLQFSGIAVDEIHEEIFVFNYNTIAVYGRTDTGSATPVRTISGASTGLSSPSGVAVDTVNDQVFAANGNDTVTVYGRTDNGDIAPVRTISGASSGLTNPRGIAVDAVNDEIFVLNYSPASITVYGRTDNGGVVPVRTISGASTGLLNPSGIAVDTVNNEIFVSNTVNTVTVYGRTDNGDIAPARTISGASTGLDSPLGIAVDPVNNEIFVANQWSVTVYGRTATGDVPFVRKFTDGSGAKSTFAGIAVDTVNNEIFMTNLFNVRVFGRLDNVNNTPPIREISGLSTPRGIAVDTVNNEIFVAIGNDDSITVFGRTDNGAILPLRTISGASTGISDPYGVALW